MNRFESKKEVNKYAAKTLSISNESLKNLAKTEDLVQTSSLLAETILSCFLILAS